MAENYKFVLFEEYCPKCKYVNEVENGFGKHCDNCLDIPARLGSSKPEYFEEREKRKL